MTPDPLTTTPAPDKPRLAGAAVIAALLASTAMSGFGVGSAFWDGLAAANPAAWFGFAIIGGGLAASELAAIAIAMAITRDGWTWARGALFGFCTIANVLAGHYGADAINTRLVAPQRAPFEQAIADADAQLSAARNGLDAFEARASADRATLEAQLSADRAAAPGAVTARGRQAQEARNTLAAQQRADRGALEHDLAAAQAAQGAATAAITQAPSGLSQIQTWALSALLECLKGVLVWVAAPPARRRRSLKTGETVAIQPAEVRHLDDDELEAAWESLGPARALSTTIWHERRRRGREAA